MQQSKSQRRLLTPDVLRKIERLAMVARQNQLGLTRGERRSKRKGISTEFADYRSYVQGDDLRFVDWNIYARLDAVFLKLFQDQEDLTIHLLIDSSQSMSFGTPPKIDFACQLAAALGYVGLVNYDRVSVEAFSDSQCLSLRPCRGKVSAGRLFGFLETIQPDGQTALERSCRSYTLRNRAKGVAVLISDFFDPEGFEEGLKRLSVYGEDAYAIQVLAPEEIDPELVGDLKLVDSETEQFAEISVTGNLMKQYKANRDGYCETVRRFCMARGIGYFNVSSATAVEELALGVLRKGGMLR